MTRANEITLDRFLQAQQRRCAKLAAVGLAHCATRLSDLEPIGGETVISRGTCGGGGRGLYSPQRRPDDGVEWLAMIIMKESQ